MTIQSAEPPDSPISFKVTFPSRLLLQHIIKAKLAALKENSKEEQTEEQPVEINEQILAEYVEQLFASQLYLLAPRGARVTAEPLPNPG